MAGRVSPGDLAGILSGNMVKGRLSGGAGTIDVVRFENVGLRYGNGREILKDVSFGIEEGSFHCLTGPSGAGKSTLLKLLFLALRPTRGLIKLSTAISPSCAVRKFPRCAGASEWCSRTSSSSTI